MKYYAHSLNGEPFENWHSLEEHLWQVAELAACFAAEFSAAEWAYLAGLWHDLGKYAVEFQQYIRAANDAHLEGKPGRVDHSTAGALQAMARLDRPGMILAYLLAGHHAGLPDWQSESSPQSSLQYRLARNELLQKVDSVAPEAILLNHLRPTDKAKSGTELSRSLWLRMLFSCLVDADFLDTEAFMDPEKARSREGYPPLAELAPLFESYMAKKTGNAPDTPVNRIRAEVLAACREEATEAPGLFTLTVPTGGGKTLSSCAFALGHALAYNKRRIIYVIPYTSIIEQTADQFRQIFDDAVLEHHSNLDVADQNRETARSRLACENWDAPVIVTTSVQFFESLFASRTSRCRKLHNMVNSVVILDEAQLLPSNFLKPVLEVMRELQMNYGVTFVLSTATQPALGPHKNMDFDFPGLPDLREIIPSSLNLHERLQRTTVEVVDKLDKPLGWDELAARSGEHDSVLCIVNRRDDARTLWEKMPQGSFHLSALMCGAHRSARIAEIKASLKDGRPTRVVSTQLVEAGVDFDFPVVYRALAGLDSVAQAAGRCNREGRLAAGRVYIFQPESKIPVGHLRQAAEIGRQLLAAAEGDLLAPERFERFFKTLYWIKGDGLDNQGIMALLANDRDLRISFRSAAEKFRLIDDAASASVVVHYGEGSRLIELLRRQEPERWLLRRLQRFVVNLPRSIHGRLAAEGAIEEIRPGIFVQAQGNLYDEQLGLCVDRSMIYAPDELLI
jgi:CRISPR-associated endonuclease/helicase Cas3